MNARADGQDEQNKDHSRKNFDGQRLVKATFENSNLTSTTFRRAILTGANFQNAQVAYTTFTDAKMQKTDFRGATFDHAHFQNTDLTEASFAETDLSKQGFFNCKLSKASFLNVTGIIELDRCDLTKADFRGANLVGMSMIGLSQSNFRGATYDSRTVWPDGFDPKARGAELVADGPEPHAIDEKPDENPKNDPAPEMVVPEKKASPKAPPKKQPADAPKSRLDMNADTGIPASPVKFDDRDAAVLFQAGRYSQAEALYRQLMKTRPNDPEIIGGLLAAVAAQGKDDDVRKLTEQLIRIKQGPDAVAPISVEPVDPAPANPNPLMQDDVPDKKTPVPHDGDTGADDVQPIPVNFVDDKPQGLFFMTRHWPDGTLEKAAYYFTGNVVYQNLMNGFSREDLTSHKGQIGRYRFVGNRLEVDWTDGTKSGSDYARTESGFEWDAGFFTAAKPVSSLKTLVGLYRGGEALAIEENRVSVYKDLQLNTDKSFVWNSEGTVDGGGVAGKHRKAMQGSWQASDYTITLRSQDGKTHRLIAFVTPDEGSPVELFIGGMMYKKVE